METDGNTHQVLASTANPSSDGIINLAVVEGTSPSPDTIIRDDLLSHLQ
jgi:hypothetical protein